jgi:hypothetical protein
MATLLEAEMLTVLQAMFESLNAIALFAGGTAGEGRRSGQAHRQGEVRDHGRHDALGGGKHLRHVQMRDGYEVRPLPNV